MRLFHARRTRDSLKACALGALASALLYCALPIDDAAAQYAGARVGPAPSAPAVPAAPQRANGNAAVDASGLPPPVLTPGAPPPVLAAAPPPAAPPPPGGAPSDTVVVNLIRLLVQEGVLTQDRADTLIHQAQDEAVATARAAPPRPTIGMPIEPDVEAEGSPVMQPQAAPPQQVASAAPPSIRVPYIPQIVRDQIRDEVKQEVIQQAIQENWAQPNQVPDWTKRITIDGDFRTRYEWDLFDPRNSPFFPNFAALNAGAPFDLNNSAGTAPPLLNTTQDRQRPRIRARLGITAEITDGFFAGLRIATGNTTNPVTTNQNLGTTLNKDNFLLDRAYIEYRPDADSHLWLGRFANPLFTPTELVWDEDINFDGVAGQYNTSVNKYLSVFGTAGAFPIEIGGFNTPDNSAVKTNSRDKWMFGAQVGAYFSPVENTTARLGVSYYRFDSIEGKLSSPCVAQSSADPCNTDNSRPGFLQGGNTLFALRDLVPVTSNPPIFQYYGLATPFHELNVSGRLDVADMAPMHVILDGDFVMNLAYDKNKIVVKNPVNNLGASPGAGVPGSFKGGNLGFQGRVTFGYPTLVNRWDWNISAAYRYLQSDAVVDAFTDSDFHLGGTNAKGYIVGGGLGIAHNVNLSARWLSASEITGAPYTVDVILVDLNGKF